MGFIGYARVSRKDQNLDLQIDALKQAGCEKIFTDKISSVVTRPELQKCEEHLRPGDTLVVWKLDRIGRRTAELIQWVKKLKEEKLVDFKCLTFPIDTTTPMGKMMLTLAAGFAEMERDLIIERTLAGLKAARARGRMGGRPKKFDLETEEGNSQISRAVELLKGGQFTIVEICRMLNCGQSTLYRAMERAGHPVTEINPNKLPQIEKMLERRLENAKIAEPNGKSRVGLV